MEQGCLRTRTIRCTRAIWTNPSLTTHTMDRWCRPLHLTPLCTSLTLLGTTTCLINLNKYSPIVTSNKCSSKGYSMVTLYKTPNYSGNTLLLRWHLHQRTCYLLFNRYSLRWACTPITNSLELVTQLDLIMWVSTVVVWVMHHRCESRALLMQ
jgi:hypothetical protein